MSLVRIKHFIQIPSNRRRLRQSSPLQGVTPVGNNTQARRSGTRLVEIWGQQ